MNEIIFITIVFVILFSLKIYIQSIKNPKLSAYIKVFSGLALIMLVLVPAEGKIYDSALLSVFGLSIVYIGYLDLRKIRAENTRQSL
jgi:hypothetical protein